MEASLFAITVNINVNTPQGLWVAQAAVTKLWP